jgi:pimeloyl-ACP methyl ester carboxylesterase
MAIGHVVHGLGPVRAVVIHGWFYDSRVFESMLPALDPEVFSLAFMDCRGYGSSRAMSGTFDVDTMAADAVDLASHLGWERFALVGHSMGGKAALRAAASAPHRVTRILALTPVWAGMAPFDAQTLELFRGSVRDLNLRAAILHNGREGHVPAAWSRWMAQKSAEASTVDAFGDYLESWALSDFSGQIRDLPHEILAVAGAADAGLPPEAVKATWIAHLPNARLQVLGDCGHYPMLEHPLALASIFEQFLKTA